MSEQELPRNTFDTLVDRRTIGVVYAAFALALLVLATMQRTDLILQPAAFLLLTLLVAAPLTGVLIGRGRAMRDTRAAYALLLVDAVAALGLVAATGGYASPMWVALLLVSTAAPLLIRGRHAVALIASVWAIDGLFLFQAPPAELIEASMHWLLRASGVALIGVVLRRALQAEEGLRVRSERRERVLHGFLLLSNRLRVTNQPDVILAEVAQAVQGSGEFDCVTISRLDWKRAVATVAVAIGASGRRLAAVQGLQISWDQFAQLLNEHRRVGPATYRVEKLPFRSLKDEQHLILPLSSQFAEIQGVLTVSCARTRQEELLEAMPLLELLANQAAAVLDNSALYSTLEQRVHEATAAIERSQEELKLARDRAETLYQVVRALAGSLDEREVLAQALALIAQATGATYAVVKLVEPNTGRLAPRTTFDNGTVRPATGDEPGQELAGWVLANRAPVIIADAHEDARWRPFAGASRHRSLLAVPLLFDNEPVGVIILSHHAVDHFRQEHGRLALAAADQVAIALSKAQLHRYVSEQSEQLGLTLQQREEEISKSQAILHSIADGVIVSDRLGLVRVLNPAAAEMLGVAAEAYLGRMISDLPGLDGSRDDEAPARFAQIQAGDRTLRAHHAPVFSSHGECLGKVVVLHDITREALTDRMKSEFIATASHELRTPLTSVRGYIDLLLLGTFGQLNQSQTDFLRIVKNNVARLVELIDDLLDISRAEAGEMRLRREQVDVAEVLYEVGEALYSQFTERQISLALDIPQDLPRVMADRQRLRQIIVNLVGNACKYTPPGGHVDVVLHEQHNELQVDVRDTGVGIDAASQQYIFTPFFRADNPLRDSVGGTGLGLSITKTLVDLHGGRIWFESREGEGTTFSFTLPVGVDDWTPADWLEQTA